MNYLLFCLLLPACLSFDLSLSAKEVGKDEGPPCVRIGVERLPDLNVARAEHSIFYVDGEVVVAGGHTTGFIPTPTAECYHDGKWHVMPMLYAHDHGFSVPLSSGKVLIAGGHKENLGIGQTFEAERYDPVHHRFEAFGCLDQKRVMAAGVEVDSGRVLVAGNWYAKDGLELFDGHHTFSFVKEVEVEHAVPYLLRSTADDVMVLGSLGPRGESLFSRMVTRWRGDSFSVPLLDQWQPLPFAFDRHIDDSFVGDTAQGDYAYLLLLHDRSDSLAIGLVHGTHFSLLPTSCGIPRKSPWGTDITFFSHVVADRGEKRGYVVGIDTDYRFYVLGIDYAPALADTTAQAPITLYYTDPQPYPAWSAPALTAEGHLVLAGGAVKTENGHLDIDNFIPSAAAYLLCVGHQPAEAQRAHNGWPWVLLALAVMVVGGLWLWMLMRRQRSGASDEKWETDEKRKPSTEPAAPSSLPEAGGHSGAFEPMEAPGMAELRERIEQLMRQEALYLDPNFKLNDLVRHLGSNRNYVYQALNVGMGMSFVEYVNRLRAEHAVRLMREHADLSLTEIGLRSGFASNVSLYRHFKAIYGCSPKEYRERMAKE